ncbi:ABC-2 type transport system ATP-binding protein [Devosia subaequoris]|uniref:ABC-2 type transport system ATP-binding protein n=1 Tax=Devosia subaequoris TaxID=395930 RepID=A0A7W6NB42_9HYPH|nr:ABC transporter ATP-binding protein [Devosia subaequoris]MBB4052179.1 ABC-2 type transport system ATP-binding protein [Devosia subaequoris]MCP1209342.1 ABC transporter ATP-binding protein [Devosia subaequoris]
MTELSISADPIVSARGLSKSFGRKKILHDLDFDIPAGRIYGLIGHNGAGKTTTLNAMLGLTSYEGTIRVLGEDPFARRAKLMENVAFISDVASLPRFLRVRELFALLANIHPNFSPDKARQFLEGTDIRPEMKIRTLSKGMIAQLHLAVVMAIDAKLLVLDEPTLGLDITYRKRFYRRLLEDYMTEERTLIITTHQVDEIEFMLSDIMFIRDGEMILHMQMETVSEKFTQLVVDSAEAQAQARANGPVYEETRFGQTVFIFDGVEREKLEPLGRISTPTISDLFVALMQRPTANPETAR